MVISISQFGKIGRHDVKDPVVTATVSGDGNITLSGEQTINGVLTSTDRVILTDQTAPAENGIWLTAAGAWSRPYDFDEDADVSNGATVIVTDGSSTYDGWQFILTTADPITIDTTGLTFATLKPFVNHAADHTDGTDDIQDATAAQKGLATATQITKLDNIEALADVTDATNVNSAGAVMETDYNAQTVLVAVSDDTPTAVTIADSELVGRPSGGNVGAVTATQARTVLNVEDGADVTDATNVKSSGAPVWTKYTVPYTSFTAAATTEDIELFSLPAGDVIHAVKLKHSASFTGGSISAYTLSVGISGTEDKYLTASDVFTAPGDAVHYLSSTVGTEDHASATSIRIEAISTSDNVNAATAGSADVWVMTSNAT